MNPKHFESLYPGSTRDDELSRIVSFVREGNSCQLIGVPGVGRSNIVGLLSYNKAIRLKHFPTTYSYIHLVNIDFSEVRKRPLLDVMKVLFLSLTDSLKERELKDEYERVNAILRDVLSFNDELVLTQGLKRAVEYLCVEKKLTVIFLFDRFEEYISSVTPEFFTNLRILRNLAKYRLSVVFSVARPLEDVLESTLLADFYEFIVGHHVYVRMYDPVSVEFRIAYLEKMTGKRVSEEILKEVITLTGGHGRLTRLGCEAMLADSEEFIDGPKKILTPIKSELNQVQGFGSEGSKQKAGQITQPLRDDKLELFLLEQPTIRNGLLDIWKSLTPSEQEYLDVILEGDHAVQGVPIESDDDAIHNESKKYLENVGLIEGGKCCLPLLGRFMDESKRIQATEKAEIVFDEATNTIKKGEVVLSDILTAAEFRLLKYLLLNPDQVMERENVISVVWQASATTLGVTDQAVDQLVFRLRKKIEDDPNHPMHLQTVKGRGFRFVE